MQGDSSRKTDLPPRPSVDGHASVSLFIGAMIRWRRQTDPAFSVRKAAKGIPGLSHSLVSQVARGKRGMTRDRLPLFARLLGLKAAEAAALDRKLLIERTPGKAKAAPGPRHPSRPERGELTNHLLKDWVNVYVKDAFGVRGARPDASVIHRILGGIAPVGRIRKSIDFLVREGYLRRTLKGKLVKNEEIAVTSDGIPNAKIRAAHKQALRIAQRAIDAYPPSRRKAMTLLLTLDRSSAEELNGLIDDFYERAMAFLEERPNEDEGLYQLILNLSPIGGNHEA